MSAIKRTQSVNGDDQINRSRSRGPRIEAKSKALQITINKTQSTIKVYTSVMKCSNTINEQLDKKHESRSQSREPNQRTELTARVSRSEDSKSTSKTFFVSTFTSLNPIHFLISHSVSARRALSGLRN